jgi:hypothetical protein
MQLMVIARSKIPRIVIVSIKVTQVIARSVATKQSKQSRV